MKHTKPRLELISEFYGAPPEALFPQETLCAVLGCSSALAERNRWAGSGVPFIKLNRSVRYKKADILQWIDQQKTFTSTSQVVCKEGE
jgi:hypothetical protein